MRWALWFVLVPQGYLVAGWAAESGLPLIDLGAVLCLFCALWAEPRLLPGLLLGAAIGRALVDEASIPVQILVLGVPIAVLLPLRSLFYRHHAWWQVGAAALCAVAIPKLASLCGQWFDQPSAKAMLDGATVAWTAALGPLVLWPLRRLPPLRSFAERSA
ncbi:MAG: hypothetical protein AB7O97_21995 [Planctomycetota bacterium]